jgi:hypothetical protein
MVGCSAERQQLPADGGHRTEPLQREQWVLQVVVDPGEDDDIERPKQVGVDVVDGCRDVGCRRFPDVVEYAEAVRWGS